MPKRRSSAFSPVSSPAALRLPGVSRAATRPLGGGQRLGIETLEPRYALDTGLASLASDLFVADQNGTASAFDVLANDQFGDDYDGLRRITAVSYGNQGGTVAIGPAGEHISYTPPADFFGTETFVYVVDDHLRAEVSVTVRPLLAFDTFQVAPDGVPRELDVLANDPFWPEYDGPREITAVSVGSLGGEVVLDAASNRISYTPSLGVSGTEQFVYIVDHRYPARVTITLPATLADDQFEIVQQTTATLAVLANDPFWAGYQGERRITRVLDLNDGSTAEISADGRSLLYTAGDSSGTWDSFRYVVDDQYEARVSLAIHRPVQDDWLQIDQGSSDFFVDVLANDFYHDLRHVRRDVVDRVTSVGQPASGGTAVVADNGRGIRYTPPADFVGSDEFTYIADGVHTAVVRVQVERPVRDDYFGNLAVQDSPGVVLPVLANDFIGNGYDTTGPGAGTGTGGSRLITGVGPTSQGGTVTIAADGRSVAYTPAEGFTGTDTFRYTVDETLEAEATVFVRALAQGDSFHFCPHPSQSFYDLPVLANDPLNRGYPGPGAITSVTQPAAGGTTEITAGRGIRFTPPPGGLSPGSSVHFDYTIDDHYSASAWVSFANHLASDQAVADQNGAFQTIDVLANDFQLSSWHSCPSGQYKGPRQITAVMSSATGGATAAGGQVEIAADGRSVRYKPPADFRGTDSFTYAVDGVMQQTVRVEVIRRVRDDRFRVAPEAQAERLPVLVNDLLGGDYLPGDHSVPSGATGGVRQITAVTSTAAGGTVEIAENRRELLYTPPAGFSGTDSFGYTVDGQLLATVEVVVGGQADEQYPAFASADALAQFLIDDALLRYEGLFGQPAWSLRGEAVDFTTADFGAAPRDSAPRDHSETNVQVAGIDEADIIEFDADYVYLLSDGELVIVDAWPAAEMHVASRVAVEGRAVAQFLAGDRLTVISEIGGYGYGLEVDLSFDLSGGAFGRGDIVFPGPILPAYTPYSTIVTVLDVSDRTDVQIVQSTSMEGKYVDARAVNEHVYVLVRNDAAIAPAPEVIPAEDPADDSEERGLIFGPSGTYETRAEYLARWEGDRAALLDAALPNYTAYGPDGAIDHGGLLTAPEAIRQPLADDSRSLISIVSFATSADTPGPAASEAVYASGGSTIYASHESFYVFEGGHTAEDGATTRILKFDWNGPQGAVAFAGQTSVPGTMLNQFAADEHDGLLRIATTISNQHSGNWTGRSENTLFVLRDDAGVFEPVGSLQNLALDESIRSVRFLGERALVTTFRTIDPLFGLDLSDPAEPRAVGHLTLPGFSSYMQPIGDDLLLTVGQNTADGSRGPTQVALFDISELSQPQRLDEYTFARFSTSEAEFDHHAFGYFAAHGLLAIPTASGYVERIDADGDGYRETSRWVQDHRLAILAIDVSAREGGAGEGNFQAAIELAGEIEHEAVVRRSGYIGGQALFVWRRGAPGRRCPRPKRRDRRGLFDTATAERPHRPRRPGPGKRTLEKSGSRLSGLAAGIWQPIRCRCRLHSRAGCGSQWRRRWIRSTRVAAHGRAHAQRSFDARPDSRAGSLGNRLWRTRRALAGTGRNPALELADRPGAAPQLCGPAPRAAASWRTGRGVWQLR
jgi:hypothetical protein